MYPSDYLNDEHVSIFDTLIVEKRFAGASPAILSINMNNENQYPLIYTFNKQYLSSNDNYLVSNITENNMAISDLCIFFLIFILKVCIMEGTKMGYRVL